MSAMMVKFMPRQMVLDPPANSDGPVLILLVLAQATQIG